MGPTAGYAVPCSVFAPLKPPSSGVLEKRRFLVGRWENNHARMPPSQYSAYAHNLSAAGVFAFTFRPKVLRIAATTTDLSPHCHVVGLRFYPLFALLF
ncbi:hypothetical protein Q1695_013408 [Nippostrongylus brasiliensis]|nr:hypothetical protein Q1695_013408 [Nippostrongylus brasiliensis]